VALAAVRERDAALAFYPFADFSPELAAIRWAAGRGVPVRAFDLPWSSRGWGREGPSGERAAAQDAVGFRTLYGRAGVADGEELWDRLVEVRAPGSDPESIRRAALAVGWTLRQLTSAVSEVDLAREAWMRREIAAAPGRTAVVAGAFHAPALLAGGEVADEAPARADAGTDVVTSLIPYTFRLLDSRSGYPAGIRDPEWQQAVFEAALDPAAVDALAGSLATAIAAALRDAGHAAGTVDATEIARMATDLARLRGHAAPGRRELVEACTSALAQGDVLGRGRAVAGAMDRVLVGSRHGRLAAGTPRSGLAPHVESVLRDLRLPGPGDPEADLRLDPLRSDLDRRRHVTLTRLEVCSVPYGRAIEGSGLGVETLTRRWTARWQPATSALLELAGTRGVTLEQAAVGAVRARLTALADASEGGLPPTEQVRALRDAAEAGLAGLAAALVRDLAGEFLGRAGLAELLAATDELERITRGHVPGLRPPDGPGAAELADVSAQLLAAAIRALDGIAGSTRPEDAFALASLVRRRDASDAVGDARIGWALERICHGGSPLMQGAAEAISTVIGRRAPGAYASILGSWVDGAHDLAAHRDLAARLRGTVLVAAPVLEGAATLLTALSDRVEALDDAGFIARLPALRDGFDLLSTAARQRFLAAVFEAKGLDGRVDLSLEATADWIAAWADADAAGLEAVRSLLPALLAEPGTAVVVGATSTDDLASGPQKADAPIVAPHANRLSLVDRWRLILGEEPDAMEPEAMRLASALDELYGAHGEGSRAGVGGGTGPAGFPSAREWAEELDALFGERVREEVLGRAAERGNTAVLDHLEPAEVTPSVDMLEQILGLAGAVPEASLGRLRAMVRHVVDELVRQLAVTVRPALTGSALARPTRRRGARLHLARTVRANLRTVRQSDAGQPVLIPEQPWFQARARRSFDWRVVLCVDVSGSMEASTIYAALMAAIISALPSVTTHFVAFSDTVVDLTGRVDDPLALLLEIRVGGGTNIGQALRYARSLVTVPRRTIVVVVSDFDEGASVGALASEVRALAAGGSRLLGLAALDDRGAPRFEAGVAGEVVAAGMPIAALTPAELAAWVGEQLRGA
jgi:hypothetical protein